MKRISNKLRTATGVASNSFGRRWLAAASAGLAAVATFGAMAAAAGIVGGGPAASTASDESQFTATVRTDVGDIGSTISTTVTNPSSAPAAGDEAAAEAAASDGTAIPTEAMARITADTIEAGVTAATAAATAASDAHTNGHGCDDIIHAGDRPPGPGGPVGCTVGNSGDHRQNGATSTPGDSDEEEASTPTPTAAAAPAEDKTDPHANGHGCDDVNHAGGEHEPTHGGPVGCTVGNSGDHRQNGLGGATPESTAPAAASTPTGGSGEAPAGKGGTGKGHKPGS